MKLKPSGISKQNSNGEYQETER